LINESHYLFNWLIIVLIKEKWKVENKKLVSDVEELKNQNAQQDEEILLLKNRISHLESLLPSKWVSNNSNKMDNVASSANHGPPIKVLIGPPSSCQELYDKNGLARPVDGIHLLKIESKIQAAFCTFPARVSKDKGKLGTALKYHIIRLKLHVSI